MSNSSLVTYKAITSHKWAGRNGCTISKIFVHHMAGNLSVKTCGNVFKTNPASAHYGINGKSIGQYVLEEDTAWHCGNRAYNYKSIGIECANDGKKNWHISDQTIDTLIKLLTDICERNRIGKLRYTGDLTGNLCQHNWVAATSCPGPYMSTKFSYIAAEVNKRLASGIVLPQRGYFKKGDKGSYVKVLQKWLKKHGFEPGDIDGIYGPKTADAVRRFQKRNGLTIDGEFGIKSLHKANEISAK